MAPARRFPSFPSEKEIRLGKWSLTTNHDLKLTLRRSKTQPLVESFTLTGEIISSSAHELVFSVRTKEEDSLKEIRLLRLKGRWHANENNQLVFLVQKGNREEPLTFEGVWEIGERHELLYRYQKEDPATGHKEEKFISFRGFWEIREKDHLTYSLDLPGNSRFDFEATVGSPSLLAKQGEIRYQIGIRLKGETLLVRKIVFFGKWKVSKDFSLSFEMEYKEGRRHTLSFETTYRVNEKDELIFRLKNQRGADLGIEVTFTKRFFETEGKAFLRLYKDAVESRIEGGVRVPF